MAIHACTLCPDEFDHHYELDRHIAAAHTRLFTMDNYLITDGMPVWDYNLDVVSVNLSTASPEANGDVWFSTKTPKGGRGPLMNGQRVRTRHPSTGQRAADAWAALTQDVTITVGIVWPDGSSFTWADVPEEMADEIKSLLGDNYDMKV